MARTNINFEDKRMELILTACNLFLEKGYEETTISAIMKKATISKGALYHYFTSKSEILDAVIYYLIDIEYERRKPIMKNPRLDAIEKLILSNKIDSPQDETVYQAMLYAKNNPQSILFYRAKELNFKRVTPEISNLLSQGVEDGIFSIIAPDITATVFYQVTQGMLEKQALDVSDKENYFLFIKQLLGLTDENAKRLVKILD